MTDFDACRWNLVHDHLLTALAELRDITGLLKYMTVTEDLGIIQGDIAQARVILEGVAQHIKTLSLPERQAHGWKHDETQTR